jgi:hypothetical protein
METRTTAAWALGVDFAPASDRVIAVHIGGEELKYGIEWIGPVDRREYVVRRELERWGDRVLDLHGGYIHLFPADGSGWEVLHDYNDALDEEEEADG